jgi:hypothetical protein
MMLTWTRRILLVLPFVTAGVLTFLIGFADRLHLRSERFAGYGFLFGIPWAWLVDRGWFEHVHSRFAQSLVGYAVVLWIPAILYSACLWLLLWPLGYWVRRTRV